MAVSNQEVAAYLAANPGLSDAQIAQAASAAGVSPQQLAEVTGIPLQEVQQRIENAMPEQRSALNTTFSNIDPNSLTKQYDAYDNAILVDAQGNVYNPVYGGEMNTLQSLNRVSDMNGNPLSQYFDANGNFINATENKNYGSGSNGIARDYDITGKMTERAYTNDEWAPWKDIIKYIGGAALGANALGALTGGPSGFTGMFGGAAGTTGLTAEQLAAVNALGGAEVAGGLTAAEAAAAGLGGGFTGVGAGLLGSTGLTAEQISAIESLGGADVAGGLTAADAATAGLGGGFTTISSILSDLGLTAEQISAIEGLGGADVAGGLTTADATTAGLGGGLTGVTTGDVTGVTTGGTTGNTTGVTTGGTTGVTTGGLTGLTGLTTDQLINLVKSGVSLTGLLGAGKVITGGSGGGSGGTTTFKSPTQGIPQNNPAYYNQLQQYYNGYLPQSPRDVVTPLQQWYNSSYGA